MLITALSISGISIGRPCTAKAPANEDILDGLLSDPIITCPIYCLFKASSVRSGKGFSLSLSSSRRISLRHLATDSGALPHLERAIFPWQCGYYPADHSADEVTPWIDAFINARKWIENVKA